MVNKRTRGYAFRRIVLSLMLICCFLATSACNMIEIDMEMDLAEPVATFGEHSVTKGEIKSLYDFYVSYYAAYLGTDLASDKESSLELVESLILEAVDEKISELKIEELALALTDEEIAEIRTEAEEAYQDELESRLEEALSENEDETAVDEDTTEEPTEEPSEDESSEDKKTEAELRAEIEAELINEGMDPDTVVEKETQTRLQEKLSEYIVKDVEVSEAEVEEAYNLELAQQQGSYIGNEPQFESDYMNGSRILYYPSDYSRVKHILIGKPTDEESEEVTAIREQAYSIDPETDEETVIDEDKLTEADELLLSYVDTRRDAAQEVLDRLNNGEDFDALVAEVGEDPGMRSEPMLSNGYLVNENNTSFVTPYVEAAVPLTEIGETTELVRTTLGWFIIRKVGEVKAGDTVEVKDVYDDIYEEVLGDKKDTVTEETKAQWRTDMKLRMYPERIVN